MRQRVLWSFAEEALSMRVSTVTIFWGATQIFFVSVFFCELLFAVFVCVSLGIVDV
jgi:monomeric isocitrate dehydrogenase